MCFARVSYKKLFSQAIFEHLNIPQCDAENAVLCGGVALGVMLSIAIFIVITIAIIYRRCCAPTEQERADAHRERKKNRQEREMQQYALLLCLWILYADQIF